MKLTYVLLLVVMLCAAAAASPAASCACAKIYRPLCASNGRSYNNECELECRNKHLPQHERLQVLFQGRCDGSP